MINRSIVTTEVAVCFTTSFILIGSGGVRAGDSPCGIVACIGFVTVGPIPVTQALPNVTEGKSFALRELLHVTKLVKEQLGIESRCGRKEYRAPERDRGNGRLTQHPAAHPQRKTATAEPQIAQLGPARRQRLRQLEMLAEQSCLYL